MVYSRNHTTAIFGRSTDTNNDDNDNDGNDDDDDDDDTFRYAELLRLFLEGFDDIDVIGNTIILLLHYFT